jgi:hypothetical protein
MVKNGNDALKLSRLRPILEGSSTPYTVLVISEMHSSHTVRPLEPQPESLSRYLTHKGDRC